jgi:hypothetical protein
MPHIDFGHVDEARDFDPIPRGTYPCRLAKIEEEVTRHNDEMWKLVWVVESGPHQGHEIWDWLPFSVGALPRVKKLCRAVGIDTSRSADLIPGMFLDRRAHVTIVVGQYQTDDGDLRPCNKVTWAGYDPIPPRDHGDDRAPF